MRELLHPGTLLGVTAVSVLGGDREVEEQPAITLWAARLGAPVTPVRLDASVPSIGIAVSGLDHELVGDTQERTLLLLADPFSMPGRRLSRGCARDVSRSPHHRRAGIGRPRAGRQPARARRPAVHRWRRRCAAPARRFVDGRRVAGVPSDRHPDDRDEERRAHHLRARGASGARAPRRAAREPRRRGARARPARHPSRPRHRRAQDRLRSRRLPHPHRARRRPRRRRDRGGRRGRHRRHRPVSSSETPTPRTTICASCSQAEGRRARSSSPATAGARICSASPITTRKSINAHVDGGATAGMFCAGELGPIGDRSFLHGFTASILLFGD